MKFEECADILKGYHKALQDEGIHAVRSALAMTKRLENGCPTTEEIINAVHRRMPDMTRRVIYRHFEKCLDCRRKVLGIE